MMGTMRLVTEFETDAQQALIPAVSPVVYGRELRSLQLLV